MTRDEITSTIQAEGGMFAVIPAVVMQDTALSMSARMLYGVLTWRSNKNACCWPTNRELAGDLGLSAKRVSALLSLLEERGHIETEVACDKATGQVIRRYIYPVMKSGRGIPKNEDTPPQIQGDPSPSSGGPLPENAEVYKEKYKKENKINITPKAPQGGQAAPKKRKGKSVPTWKPERFERFWAYYPRGEDRVGAVREWDRLKPDDALIAVMARALEAQKAGEMWRQGVGIPYACRWLRNRRWEDTPPEAASGRAGARVVENEKVRTW